MTARPKPCGLPVSVTSTSKRPAWSVSAILTGSAGQCCRCASTALEHASPTASRTSSSMSSATPLRLATAVATRRAVRTCAGSAVKLTSTVGIRVSGVSRRLLLGLSCLDGLVDRVVDAEHLRQARDPEDLENPLLRADQIQGAVMRPDPLQAADQHTQAGGVEELDLLHIHHELIEAGVDQLDEKLTQARRGVDVDLAFHVDDLDPILGVVIQLQIHKILQRHAVKGLSVQPELERARSRHLPARIQSRSEVMSIPDRSSRHSPPLMTH